MKKRSLFLALIGLAAVFIYFAGGCGRMVQQTPVPTTIVTTTSTTTGSTSTTGGIPGSTTTTGYYPPYTGTTSSTTTSFTTTTIVYQVSGTVTKNVCTYEALDVLLSTSIITTPSDTDEIGAIVDGHFSSGTTYNYVLSTTEAGTYYIFASAPPYANPVYIGGYGVANIFFYLSELKTITFDHNNHSTWTQSGKNFSLFKNP